MQSVGIKALKNRLSEYLRAVGAGETVLVTHRGRVVAEIVPPRDSESASPAEQKMNALVREGVLTPAKLSPNTRLPRRKPVATLSEILRDLDASRGDR